MGDRLVEDVIAAHTLYCKRILKLRGGQTAILSNGRVSVICSPLYYFRGVASILGGGSRNNLLASRLYVFVASLHPCQVAEGKEASCKHWTVSTRRRVTPTASMFR